MPIRIARLPPHPAPRVSRCFPRLRRLDISWMNSALNDVDNFPLHPVCATAPLMGVPTITRAGCVRRHFLGCRFTTAARYQRGDDWDPFGSWNHCSLTSLRRYGYHPRAAKVRQIPSAVPPLRHRPHFSAFGQTIAPGAFWINISARLDNPGSPLPTSALALLRAIERETPLPHSTLLPAATEPAVNLVMP